MTWRLKASTDGNEPDAFRVNCKNYLEKSPQPIAAQTCCNTPRSTARNVALGQIRR